MVHLPAQISACLFDLDGVLTRTAVIHAAAWKQTFDELLARRAGAGGFRPFDSSDYDEYVDGKPRLDGVRSLLRSRDIDLPEGSRDDPPETDTVHGLGRRKNDLVLELMRTRGVEAYDGSVRFVHAVRKRGMPCAVVSASTNCRDVLEAAGIEHLFDVRVDGIVAERDGLAGKPAPDTFLAAAAALRTEPARGAVFEDALAGVEAGRAGGFGCVVGVDRSGEAGALRRRGADVVVRDLSELLEGE